MSKQKSGPKLRLVDLPLEKTKLSNEITVPEEEESEEVVKNSVTTVTPSSAESNKEAQGEAANDDTSSSDAEFQAAFIARLKRPRRQQSSSSNVQQNNNDVVENELTWSSFIHVNHVAAELQSVMGTIEEIDHVRNALDSGLLDEAVHLSNRVLMLGGADLLSSPSSYIEKHRLTGSDEVLRFAVGRNVILHVESQQRVRDSNRINTQVLADYKWENKAGNSAGRILAARDKLLAYRLFNETTGEAVRVLEREQRSRHLIKDFRYPTVDIQWAVHTSLLAVLDANANLYIYTVDENGQNLSKYLIIIQEGDHTSDGPARIVWCPYIPEEEGEPGEPREEIHLLGIIQGNKINLFKLNKIKEQIGRTEVTYERVKELDYGMITLELDSEITACKISPDATALAAATTDGELVFYVMEEWENVQLANRLRPLANSHIEELVFLDNLCAHNHDEQFWKYVAVSSDNGRRLALFDCDTWQCIAKLRFESPNQVTRMELLVEPSMRFLFVADYDASNLFCIELSQQMTPSGMTGPLCFAACTQIMFCSPLICVVPCTVVEQFDSAGELSLEDDEGTHSLNNLVVATLVAITQRSLLELNVELERVFTVDPSVATTNAAAMAQQPPTMSRSVLSSIQQQQQAIPAAQQQPLAVEESNTVQERVNDELGTLALATSASVNAATTVARNHVKKEVNASGYEMLGNNNVATAANNNTVAGLAAAAISAEAMEQLGDLVEKSMGKLNEKIESLSLQVHQLHDENEQLRANQNDNLSNMLEKISNELKEREERISSIVREQGTEAAEQMVRSTEALLTKYSANMQRTMELAQTRQAEQMHVSLERAVVPQVEVFCTRLFQQLNENFRSGLQEFMDHLSGLSAGTSQGISTAAQQLRQTGRPAAGNTEIVAEPPAGGAENLPAAADLAELIKCLRRVL